MKKALILLLMAVLITVMPIAGNAITESEITYRNIPWLSTPAESSEIGFCNDEASQFWLNNEMLTDLGTIGPLDSLAYGMLERTTPNNLKMGNVLQCNFDVAGYKLNYCELIYVYGIDENGNILTDATDSKFILGLYSFEFVDKKANKARASDPALLLSEYAGE